MVADFLTDVADELNKKAEDVTLEYLGLHFKGKGVEIHDARDRHGKWDFVISHGGREYTLDVKCDKYIETTKNFAFEVSHRQNDGSVTPAWGVCEDLHFIAVVPRSFTFIKVVPLLYVRSYVLVMLDLHAPETLVEHYGWKQFNIKNSGRANTWMTRGYAIPLKSIQDYLDSVNAYGITHIDLPESLHRKPGRLLIHGKKAA